MIYLDQLEKEVAEKEYLCKRIMEEMKYFKVTVFLPPVLSSHLDLSFRWNCRTERHQKQQMLSTQRSNSREEQTRDS